jgi:hypothetical protein
MYEWVTVWATEIVAAGYRPGIYEGADQPLEAAQWRQLEAVFRSLVFWRSLSLVPPIAAGYVLVQQRGNVSVDDVLVDVDLVQADAEGQTLLVAVAGAKADTPPGAAAGRQWVQQVQDLVTLTTQAQAAVDQVRTAVTALAHDLTADDAAWRA